MVPRRRIQRMDPQFKYRFPGMDPWLEDRGLWPGVHDSIMVHMAETLTSVIAPRYVARPGRRMVLEIPDRQTLPDVAVLEYTKGGHPRSSAAVVADPPVTLVFDDLEVKEIFVEIYALRPVKRLVTVIEILSYANKRSGTDSRAKYLQKQQEILSSDVHLVEIDLLRAGEPTVAIPENHLASLPRHDYRVVVRRATARDRADVYAIPLPKPLPKFPVPLLAPDADAVVDLQRIVEQVYEAGAYALECDHEGAPDPPLGADDAAWVRKNVSNGRRGKKR